MKTDGFTIFELLIVLAIIALGSALTYPHLSNSVAWCEEKCVGVNIQGLNEGIRILQLQGYGKMLTGTNNIEHNKRVVDLLMTPPWGTPLLDTSNIVVDDLESSGSGDAFVFIKYGDKMIQNSKSRRQIQTPRYSKKYRTQAWDTKRTEEASRFENTYNETKESDYSTIESLADFILRRFKK